MVRIWVYIAESRCIFVLYFFFLHEWRKRGIYTVIRGKSYYAIGGGAERAFRCFTVVRITLKGEPPPGDVKRACSRKVKVAIPGQCIDSSYVPGGEFFLKSIWQIVSNPAQPGKIQDTGGVVHRPVCRWLSSLKCDKRVAPVKSLVRWAEWAAGTY